MTHQDSIAAIIFHLLKLSDKSLESFKKGNPFDKLLRSYSEFNSCGEPLYKNKRCAKHYQFSEKAWEEYMSKKSVKMLYAEHVVPLSIIKRNILIRKFNTLNSIKKYLKENNYVVMITKREQKIIDKKFKSKLPRNRVTRLEYFNIKTSDNTKYNSLKCIK
jgi:hypothetical protein